MWEQLAVKYNASRTRASPERDVDSLKRKFKCLHAKPKPTGQGEVPLRLRPVVWAQEIMMKNEESCGVQTSHDGLDEGEDDDALETVVADVLGGEAFPRQSHSTANNADSPPAVVGGSRSLPDSQDVASQPGDPSSDHDSAAESLSAANSDAISQCAPKGSFSPHLV
jgi:hypothetical protein